MNHHSGTGDRLWIPSHTPGQREQPQCFPTSTSFTALLLLPDFPCCPGRLREGREQHFVRQINLLSVSGPICRWGQSALGGSAAQQIKSNRDYLRNVSTVSCKWDIVGLCRASRLRVTPLLSVLWTHLPQFVPIENVFDFALLIYKNK